MIVVKYKFERTKKEPKKEQRSRSKDPQVLLSSIPPTHLYPISSSNIFLVLYIYFHRSNFRKILTLNKK